MPKKQSASSKSTADDKAQLAMLERLSQDAAASLIGVTPRALRYMTDAPRNHDGTYHGQALVLWMTLRAHRGELRPKFGDECRPKI